MILNFDKLIENATQVHIGLKDMRTNILEGKILVDIHEQVVTTIFINPKFKNEVKNIWGEDDNIWGADVNYFNDIPENTALLFAFDYDFNAEDLDDNDKKLYSVVKFNN